ncbi:Pyridine nucleotide-disulfide oxidoreductase domain-containing protein 1 [Trichinella britovi]|uniref:Pyridine nucleotide-disulfide oxidoreductase domain-containing protein 1 n=1 Tax=Trichinella britovi TaxID=45882 RepID=A0A0V1C9K8_TRIBR|nr:Pyridine nucleotide-disulfide oxidoreductase domain-containing protein 1 [Trichinella britovi]
MQKEYSATFVVVGGGIAGVACVNELTTLIFREKILLITSTEVVKKIVRWQQLGRALRSLNFTGALASEVFSERPNVTVVQAYITKLDRNKKELTASDGTTFKYEKLCIATGGIPKLISENPNVVCIRDTESVEDFQNRLSGARRIIVVGNGGIATEVVGEVTNIEVIWVVKHDTITATFIDAGAAEFFLPYIHNKSIVTGPNDRPTCSKEALKARVPPVAGGVSSSGTSEEVGSKFNRGSALGPDWAGDFCMEGSLHGKRIHLEKQCSVKAVLTPEQRKELNLKDEVLPSDFAEIDSWPVYVQLTNDKVYGCDFIVNAIGVEPNTYPWVTPENDFKVADDGGLLVDDQMQTNFEDIFAAGDVCTAGWEPDPNWFQMRLWTQAKQMGSYAGLCMAMNFAGSKMELDGSFCIFSHVTKFFGFRVILLGKFNGQGLRSDHEALLRVTPGVEYVKVLIQDGVVRGAILIGDTGLSDMLENLILNETEIDHMKSDLLEPSTDIDDYFD